MHIIKYKNICIAVGMLLTFGSLAIILILGLKPGIDFTGGSLNEVVYTAPPVKTEVEQALNDLNLGGVSVRETVNESGEFGYVVRTRDLSEEERLILQNVLLDSGEGASISRFTSVGPVIGAELKTKAFWAVAAVALIIVLYVAYAFSGLKKPVGSFVYGGITIFVLVHDVLVPTALIAVLGTLYGVEVDTLFVMAILAVLGYSVNDTIVIFDRVRENIIKYRTEKKIRIKSEIGEYRDEIEYTINKPFAEIVDEAVSETLVRSINTSLTTLIALGTLYFLGGSTTQIFALVLMVGVLAGTYSSIFLANPLLVYIAEKLEKRAPKETNKVA